MFNLIEVVPCIEFENMKMKRKKNKYDDKKNWAKQIQGGSW